MTKRRRPSFKRSTLKFISRLILCRVRQKLRFVHRMNCFDRFDLDDQDVGDHDISAEPAIEHPVPIDNRKRNLPLERQASLGEFEAKAFLINRFQKPGPERFMHVDRATDHLLGQFATRQHHTPQWTSVVLGVLRVEP